MKCQFIFLYYHAIKVIMLHKWTKLLHCVCSAITEVLRQSANLRWTLGILPELSFLYCIAKSDGQCLFQSTVIIIIIFFYWDWNQEAFFSDIKQYIGNSKTAKIKLFKKCALCPMFASTIICYLRFDARYPKIITFTLFFWMCAWFCFKLGKSVVLFECNVDSLCVRTLVTDLSH